MQTDLVIIIIIIIIFLAVDVDWNIDDDCVVVENDEWFRTSCKIDKIDNSQTVTIERCELVVHGVRQEIYGPGLVLLGWKRGDGKWERRQLGTSATPVPLHIYLGVCLVPFIQLRSVWLSVWCSEWTASLFLYSFIYAFINRLSRSVDQ